MKENVFDNKLLQKQLDRIKIVEQNKEEMEKCKDPLYFYNTYVRKENQPVLTKEEYDNFLAAVERKRRNGPIKFRGDFIRPLTPEECYDKNEGALIIPPKEAFPITEGEGLWAKLDRKYKKPTFTLEGFKKALFDFFENTQK